MLALTSHVKQCSERYVLEMLRVRSDFEALSINPSIYFSKHNGITNGSGENLSMEREQMKSGFLQVHPHAYYLSVPLSFTRYRQLVLLCYFNIKRRSKGTMMGDEKQHVAYSQPSTFQSAFRKGSLI